jgi:hypothetical protein
MSSFSEKIYKKKNAAISDETVRLSADVKSAQILSSPIFSVERVGMAWF